MLLSHGLLLEFGSNFRALGLSQSKGDPLMQSPPFLLRVKAVRSGGRVVGTEFLAHPAVTRARYVTGRQVDQSAMIRFADKREHIHGRVDIGDQGVAQIRIEIGETGTVDDQVQPPLQTYRVFGVETKAGLRNVAFDNFDLRL